MKDLGILDFKVDDIGRAGFSGMNAALGSLGFTNRGQLFNNAQATLVGSAMAAAHAASIKGLSPTEVQAEYNKVLNTPAARQIQRNSYNTIKSSIAENMGKTSISDAELVTEMARVERTAIQDKETGFNRQTPRGSKPGQPADAEFRSNVVTDKNGNPVTSKRTGKNVLTAAGKARKDKLNAIAKQAKINKEEATRRAEYEAKRQAGIDARVAQQENIAKKQASLIASGQYEDVGSSDDFSDAFGDDGGSGGFSDSFGDTGPEGEGSGGISDAFGGGDYKGAFVGEVYKKNKLASQMKRSGLASKK
jgi:hypothetical protein